MSNEARCRIYPRCNRLLVCDYCLMCAEHCDCQKPDPDLFVDDGLYTPDDHDEEV